MPNETYDIKISLKKFVTGFAYIGIPLLVSYSLEFLETEEFPPAYALYTALAVGILHFASNAIKHGILKKYLG